MLTLLQPLPLLVERWKHQFCQQMQRPVNSKQLPCCSVVPGVCCLQELHLAAEPTAHTCCWLKLSLANVVCRAAATKAFAIAAFVRA